MGRQGHRVRLLRGARELIPAMVEAMALAEHFIALETYIFEFSGLPLDVAQALEAAALRGVEVHVVVDGVGTPSIPLEWQKRWEQAGVKWRVFLPMGRLGLILPQQWRRLHRKLCSIDGSTGFCGGINLIEDTQDKRLGILKKPRFDLSVMMQGAVVREMTRSMWRLWWRDVAVQDAKKGQFRQMWRAIKKMRPVHKKSWRWLSRQREVSDDAVVMADQVAIDWVVRDNWRHRKSIEKAFIQAINNARDEIVCAMAYFLPGHSLRQAMIEAVKRGVKVHVLLQGLYENFWQYHASKPLHIALLKQGVQIHEYVPSALHAKVMVVDACWSTVGSSNMDPLSLLVAKEANVVVHDAQFGYDVAQTIKWAISQKGRALYVHDFVARTFKDRLRDRIAYWAMKSAIFLTGHRY